MTIKHKKDSVNGVIGVVVFFLLLILGYVFLVNKKEPIQTIPPVVKSADAKILADGVVRSQNEANLHFATGGKLVYLPYKEGDRVVKGATIASLDTFAIQKQLQLALNNYRTTRDSFDQLQDNNKNNYLQAQQANPYPFNYFNLAGIGGTDKTDAVNDMIKRLLDQSQAGLDNSVTQVELANYAYTLSALTAPFDGVITHLDVTSPNQVVSPVNSFIIIDPDSLVFRANVSEDDINFVSEGAVATIQLSGITDKKFDGVIVRIYPDKITLPTGENVYQVDIQSDDLKSVAKFKQSGTVLIKNKYDHQVILVPSWMVLTGGYIWTIDHDKPRLKKITVGDTMGETVEVTAGLSEKEKLIINPASVAGKRYFIL